MIRVGIQRKVEIYTQESEGWGLFGGGINLECGGGACHDRAAIDGQDLGSIEPLGIEGVEVGGGNQGLKAVFDDVEQMVLAGEVEFGENVIEEQERRFTDDGFDRLEFGELNRKNEGALLTLGAEMTGGVMVDPQFDVVAMGADERRSACAFGDTVAL